ncbi:MAG: TIGR03435 family protein [Candidatus Sulfopaludibacter sp.]|nr:TIGR03435 family protein [Candidatus Sulfopaludibacter sp.]
MQSLLLECAVRAALIAAATAAVLAALRVKSAAGRHVAWLGVVVWMLILPAWTAWVPKASWRILPAARPAAIRTEPISATWLPASPDMPVSGPMSGRFVWSWWTVLLAVYALGGGVLLSRLSIGAARAHALMRGARRQEGRWTSCACVSPVTVGWLRPRVILPEGWREWPAAQLAAVLAHENEHARRRDPLMQFLALLNRAIFWFHPLAWWLERRLSGLAEEACDAAALAGGHDPYDYSRYLLEMARAVERSGMRIDVLGMAMPGSSLPRRIRRILSARPRPPVSRARTVCAAGACLLLSGAFAAGALVRRNPPVRVHAPVAAAVREEAPAPLPPPAPQAQKERLVVLYLDLGVLSAGDQVRAVAAARTFVSTQMQAADRVAIMMSDGGAVQVLQDFTAARDLLLQALSQVPLGYAAQQDPDRLMDGLRDVVNMLAPLKEKKAVMYFARSMPPGTESPQSLIDAAVAANVAFFPVDIGGQDPLVPEFEVASVKPATTGGYPRGVSIPDPDRVRGTNASLSQLIQFAYQERDFQIAGPEWIDSLRYDVDAKSPAAASQNQLREMLQALLAERFGLKAHRETRDLRLYEMTVAKGVPKMPEAKDGRAPDQILQQHRHFMLGTTGALANTLSHYPGMELPVVDRTGLIAEYCFPFDLEPGQDMVSFAYERFGLKLTAKKAPTEILVIDHAEKTPIGN